MKIASRLLACGLVLALAGCASPTEAKKEETKSNAPAGFNVFSETNRQVSAAGVVGGANSDSAATSAATIALDSTAVTAKDGTAVIALNPGNGAWGGGYVEFTAADVSAYTNLVLSINTSALSAVPTTMEIKLEVGTTGNAFNLMTQSSVVNGSWTTYTVPLAQYTSTETPGIGYQNAALPGLTAVKSVGFWNPKNGETAVTGTLYVDDVHFE